jgi:signal transduction histidine kinase
VPKESNAKARDPLLAAICHDLRAPLAAVTMGANFVLQTTKNDEGSARSRRILEAMLRSCAQMERLVRNFADLSEIEGGTVALRLGLHDAGEVLTLAAESIRDAAEARHLSVEVEKPERPVTISADRDRLLRAVVHVAENAVKCAPEGSTVTLAARGDEREMVFSVTDRGPGLSTQVKKNLFDRSWHAKRANRVGAGFGLAIARGVAESHGGELDVESRRGVATTFSLRIPTGGPGAQ